MISPKPRRTVLVHGGDFLRAGLSMILEEADFRIVHSCRAPGIERARRDVDLVISDIVFDQTPRPDIVTEITASYPRAKVAILTRDFDARLFIRALMDGADGFFRPEVDSATLVSGLISMFTLDAVVIGPLAVQELRSQFPHLVSLMPVSERPALSDGEKLLVGTLMQGLSAKEMSRALALSERSVHRGIRRLLERLGARNGFEAGVLASKLGLV
jgi:DNA-binding NarL/FixJ family response regulator